MGLWLAGAASADLNKTGHTLLAAQHADGGLSLIHI